MLYLLLSIIENPAEKLIFEDVYKKYKNASMRRAWKILHNQHDAEDAFQTAWFQIAKNLDKIRCHEDAAIETYIMKTVEYKAINILNRNKEHQEKMNNSEYNPDEYISDDIIYKVCHHECYETIVKVLNQMNEKYKDIMILTYLYDLDVKSVAEQLDIKEKTVWTRLYRGKTILIEELKKRGITNE